MGMKTGSEELCVEGTSRILVVEDDPSIGSALVRGLREAGFEVALATTGELALQTAAREPVDLVVLDLNLPDLTGFDLLDAWRSRQNVPVLVLTARTELHDRLQAFHLGAIDYLPKPFWMEELVARIRARLRLPEERDRRLVRWDDVVADLDRRVVQHADGSDLGLTAHEFNVLSLLLERQGNALTRDQIAASALPLVGDRQDRTVDSHISHLRRKLGPAGQRIRTVWGIGYRFDAEDAS
jgi:DNA-binding response OmpR family regulator